MTYPTTSSISHQFSPPIFCIQLLFERISSPWESNFEGIKTTFVRFLPSSSPSTSSSSSNSSTPLYPQRQIRVGSGHLFFIRGTTTQNDGPIWLDLEAKSGGDNQKIWKGRISLIKENEKILPIVCPLQQQQQNGLNLEAHFLLNISEIQKKSDNRQQNLKNKTIEKEAQTDYLNNGVIERGTQTNKELVPETTIKEPIQQTSATTLQQIEHQKTITKQRQKDKKLIKLLLILLLKAKNENEKNFENKNLQKLSKTTNTECSLPPYSDNLFNKLIKINKIKRGHFRAQIAYLSSVHKTIVEDKKVLNFERRGEEKKKINKNKLQTTINLKNIQKQPKINKKVEESPPSSGLQSIAFSSPNSSEKGNNGRNLIIGRRLKGEENNEDLAIVRRKMKEELIKEEILNLNNNPTKIHKENQNSSPKSSNKSSPQIRQKIPEENRRSNSKSSTKSTSTSSTKSSKNQAIDAASVLSSIKNSSSPTSSKSSTKSSKSASTNTTTKNKISDEEGSTSTVTSKQTTESSTTKTTESSITTKKSSKRSSSISGGEE
ncbi:unnamed protein product [Meloidogyne enterolobii]|uniref:Uncharacterized protein n=1 Tax=Meloidogyne enterolobii TaxID=390850 RepID=A0ACB1AN85_MELEN